VHVTLGWGVDQDKTQSLRILQAYKGNKLMRFLGEFFIGPLRPEGRWQVLKSPDSRFLRKYGVLFEDNRGPPMVLRGATYVTDPVTGWVNRGKLEPHLGRPLISIGCDFLASQHFCFCLFAIMSVW